MVYEESATMDVELEDGTIEVRPAQLVFMHQLDGSARLAHALPDYCLDTELVLWFIGSTIPKIVKVVPNAQPDTEPGVHCNAHRA